MKDVTLYKGASGLFAAVCLDTVWILGNKELKLPSGQCCTASCTAAEEDQGRRESLPGDAACRVLSEILLLPEAIL